MGKPQKTTVQFIKESSIKHNNKYDYSKTNYTTCNDKVIIICPYHGEFIQTPSFHLSGGGCPSCGGSVKLTTSTFIERSIELHGDKYDYSKCEYTNSDTDVTLICKNHGEFLIKPIKHIHRKQGCKICSGYYKKTKEDFLREANEIHGGRYDYSQVILTDYSKTKIAIICNEHGIFYQLPGNHINQKQGCPDCNNRRRIDNDIFIKEAREIHGDVYDYTKVNYLGMHKKVTISCPIHGEFQVKPANHIHCKSGCMKCSRISSADTRRKDDQEFIEQARNIHGDRYDYSKVEYKGHEIPVVITCKIHGDFEQRPSSHITQKSNCPKCSGSYRRNTQEFIIEAKTIHGDRYDYSKTVYISRHEKVIIICKEHGEFTPVAGNHLRGSNCPYCINHKSVLTEDDRIDRFINFTYQIHGDKYDYSKITSLKSMDDNIVIICPYHGEFQQIAKAHMNGSECPRCSGYYKKTKEDFLTEAINLYGDRYDYSEIEYTDLATAICIKCKEHGVFLQKPTVHLRGHGCQECAGVKKLTTATFIERSIELHGDKYDYSKCEYTNSDTDVTLICKNHGEFLIKPIKHIHRKQGCKKCSTKKQYSQISLEWLKYITVGSNELQHAENGVEYRIPNSLYRADGYSKTTNTVYEFHGDIWHGNPKLFTPEERNPCTKITYGELYEKTLKKKQFILDHGYNYVEIWEYDWKRAVRAVITIQRLWRKKISKRQYPFQCDSCNFKCKYKSEWESHIITEKHKYGKRKTRSDKKVIHNCLLCHYICKTASNLKVHNLNKHGTKELRKNTFSHYCIDCDFGTYSPTIFEKHNQTNIHIKRTNK